VRVEREYVEGIVHAASEEDASIIESDSGGAASGAAGAAAFALLLNGITKTFPPSLPCGRMKYAVLFRAIWPANHIIIKKHNIVYRCEGPVCPLPWGYLAYLGLMLIKCYPKDCS
jgi:hypothetical protein